MQNDHCKKALDLQFLSVFYVQLSKVQLITLSSGLECTKNNTLRSLAQKGCAPPVYSHLLQTDCGMTA